MTVLYKRPYPPHHHGHRQQPPSFWRCLRLRKAPGGGQASQPGDAPILGSDSKIPTNLYKSIQSAQISQGSDDNSIKLTITNSDGSTVVSPDYELPSRKAKWVQLPMSLRIDTPLTYEGVIGSSPSATMYRMREGGIESSPVIQCRSVDEYRGVAVSTADCGYWVYGPGQSSVPSSTTVTKRSLSDDCKSDIEQAIAESIVDSNLESGEQIVLRVAEVMVIDGIAYFSRIVPEQLSGDTTITRRSNRYDVSIKGTLVTFAIGSSYVPDELWITYY